MKRNIDVKIRLSKEEKQRLDKNVKKTKLSREGYIRYLINGYEPQSVPPMDYFDVIRELRLIEGIMRRIADDVPASDSDLKAIYTANANRLVEICKNLQYAFLPRKKE